MASGLKVRKVTNQQKISNLNFCAVIGRNITLEKCIDFEFSRDICKGIWKIIHQEIDWLSFRFEFSHGLDNKYLFKVFEVLKRIWILGPTILLASSNMASGLKVTNQLKS